VCAPITTEAQWVKLNDFGEQITAITFINLPGTPRIGFVATRSKTYVAKIWRTSDGGVTWAPAKISSASSNIVSFIFKDSLTGWGVSWGGYVYKTTDGGLNWSPLASPHWASYDAIYYNAGSKRLFVSGDSNPDDYVSTDDGATWTQYFWGTGNVYTAYSGFAFSDALHGVVASWETNPNYYTTDGGVTWKPAKSYPGGFQPAALSGTLTFFEMDYGGSGLWRSDDGGLSWNFAYTFPVQTSLDVEGDTSMLVVQSDSNGVYISIDRGVTWTNICGPSAHDPVAYVKDYSIFAADDGSNSLWTNTIDPQHIGGPTPQFSFDTVTMIAPPCGFVDTTWHYTLDANCSGTLTSVVHAGSNAISISNPPNLPHTVKQGDSLVIHYSPAGVQFDTATIELSFTNGIETFDTTITIRGEVFGGIRAMGVLLPTMTGSPGDTVQLNPGYLISPQTSVSLPFSYTITFDRYLLSPIGHASTDNGQSRTITIHDTLVNGIPKALPILFVVGLGDGDSTKLLTSPITLGAGCSVQSNPDSGLFTLTGICTQGGNRLLDPSVHIALSSASPNPASQFAEIGFSVGETGQTSLSVSDLGGKEVLQLFNQYVQPGSFNVALDTRKLAPGVYDYILRTPSQILVKRLLVVH
jgi:hypothetical protein